MRLVEPQVFLIAKTEMTPGLDLYLKAIGDPKWQPNPEVSDGENLIEAAGRMCYRSWQEYDPAKPDCSNPNVTRVREGNLEYIQNVIGHGHGSILEHVTMSFVAHNVSRVFTHELVRHRVGVAYSQESLRYVRLEDIKFWIPESLRSHPAFGAFESFARATVGTLEVGQKTLAKMFDIDNEKSFAVKKVLTSMFRRFAPIGLATTIMFTYNLRTLRHTIALRTSEHAEEEIRIVFASIAELCKKHYPHVFADMTKNEKGEYVFGHAAKV